jgi:uncharacterized protein
MKFFLFLHGFQGTPHSDIAQITREAILGYKKSKKKSNKLEFISPDLAGLSINKIFIELENIMLKHQNHEKIFIGISLGGFLALQMHLKYSGKLILINPCLNPSKYIDKYINQTFTHHSKNREITITQKTKEQIKALELDQIPNQENILLLTQKDDLTLNYKDAINLLPNAKKIIKSNGGHEFTNFESVIPDIIAFCDLPNQN